MSVIYQGRTDAPRSYIVQTENGELHQNRSQININPSTTDSDPFSMAIRSTLMNQSHTGTAIYISLKQTNLQLRKMWYELIILFGIIINPSVGGGL